MIKPSLSEYRSIYGPNDYYEHWERAWERYDEYCRVQKREEERQKKHEEHMQFMAYQAEQQTRELRRQTRIAEERSLTVDDIRQEACNLIYNPSNLHLEENGSVTVTYKLPYATSKLNQVFEQELDTLGKNIPTESWDKMIYNAEYCGEQGWSDFSWKHSVCKAKSKTFSTSLFTRTDELGKVSVYFTNPFQYDDLKNAYLRGLQKYEDSLNTPEKCAARVYEATVAKEIAEEQSRNFVLCGVMLVSGIVLSIFAFLSIG